MKRVAVISADEYLFQKIKLALFDIARCEKIPSDGTRDGYDICFLESDSVGSTGIITMSRGKNSDLHIPFPIGDIRKYVENQEHVSAPLLLNDDSRTATFKGRKVKLTELEFALLELLMSKRRHIFTKDEILAHLWEADTDSGVVNVYIHYLRSKLEKDGERVIISSRGVGYKIDEKYLGGDTDA